MTSQRQRLGPSGSTTAAFSLLVTLLGACHDLDQIVVPPVLPDTGCDRGFIRVAGLCQPEPTSCTGDLRTCGPNGNESCCVFDLVDTKKDASQGLFDRSWDRSGNDVQDGQKLVGYQGRGAAPAIVSPFFLDRYEVTVGRFRKLYANYDEWLRNNPLPGEGRHSRSTKGGWRDFWKQSSNFATTKKILTATLNDCEPMVLNALEDSSGQRDVVGQEVRSAPADHRPMTCINWYEAYLFCIFDGGRLPTEAEWNFAAAGGSQQRPYPWSRIEGDDLVIGDEYANVAAPGGAFRVYDVGHFPKGIGRYGQYDLAGNALEWVFDWCGTCEQYRTTGETDPVEIDFSGDVNVIGRGGSFRFGWGNARTAFRQRAPNLLEGRFVDTGFRCARNGP